MFECQKPERIPTMLSTFFLRLWKQVIDCYKRHDVSWGQGRWIIVTLVLINLSGCTTQEAPPNLLRPSPALSGARGTIEQQVIQGSPTSGQPTTQAAANAVVNPAAGGGYRHP